MLAALLTTLLFATSAICGYRTSRQVGGVEANFWRITLATLLFTAWAFTYGRQFAGAPGWFMLSGFFWHRRGGFRLFPGVAAAREPAHGLADPMPDGAVRGANGMAVFGHAVAFSEVICVAVILAGVAIALAPEDRENHPARLEDRPARQRARGAGRGDGGGGHSPRLRGGGGGPPDGGCGHDGISTGAGRHL